MTAPALGVDVIDAAGVEAGEVGVVAVGSTVRVGLGEERGIVGWLVAVKEMAWVEVKELLTASVPLGLGTTVGF